MELQVSYSICAEVQEKGVSWRKAAENRENMANAVQLEGEDSRGRGLPRPRTYADRNTTKSISIGTENSGAGDMMWMQWGKTQKRLRSISVNKWKKIRQGAVDDGELLKLVYG